jgi:sterol 3beta-glucosyltransferase/vancomycin aglycone glucosyltransferase
MTVGSVRSRAQPPIGAPNLGAWANLLLWRIAAWTINQQFGPNLNALRRREGLPIIHNVLDNAFGSQGLNLISNSPTLYPPQPDWAKQHKVCGFLNPPSTPDALDPLVTEFLAAGSAPVYMTFGSMLTVEQPRHIIADAVTALLEAARLTGVRAIIQAPWQKLDPGAPATAFIVADRPDVLRLTRAPHEQILPHCAFSVHHGGAGTTHAALAAGRPCIVVPYAVDQMYWGQTLARLGVAPPPLPRHQLTGQRLAQRMRTLLHNPQAEQTAQRLGQQLRAEDGITTAVRWVEEFALRQG